MTGFIARLRRDRGLLLLLLLLLGGLPLVTTRIYASDEIKYFAYLHSLAFDGDLDFSNDYGHWIDAACRNDAPAKPSTKCLQLRTLLKPNPTTGLPINEAPLGTALFWAPAFALAHLGVLAARALGARVAADGYSPPYIAAVCYASYLYGWLGLLLGYRLLRRLFDPFIAVVAVPAVWLGTSAFFYMVIAPPWSHAVSLGTVALFTTVWWTTRRPAGRHPREWVALGLCAGLMMLVREQDALFLALPAVETLFRLWADLTAQRRAAPTPQPPPLKGEGESDDLTSDSSPKERGESEAGDSPSPFRGGGWGVGAVAALRTALAGWAILGGVAALTLTPQLIAYRVLGGRWGPSSTVGDKFNWLSPHALQVAFDPAYGLVPWAPLILVAALGLIALARRDRELAVALVVAFLAQVYIAGAFSTWQGKSSFGQRRFVNCTVLFAVGLGAALAWAQERGVRRSWLVATAALAVAWEGGLVVQYAADWSSAQRQAGLSWPSIVAAQLGLPLRLPAIAWQFLTNRGTFFKGGS